MRHASRLVYTRENGGGGKKFAGKIADICPIASFFFPWKVGGGGKGDPSLQGESPSESQPQSPSFDLQQILTVVSSMLSSARTLRGFCKRFFASLRGFRKRFFAFVCFPACRVSLCRPGARRVERNLDSGTTAHIPLALLEPDLQVGVLEIARNTLIRRQL